MAVENIVANLATIPSYGMIAAAINTTVTEILFFLSLAGPRTAGDPGLDWLRLFGGPLLAGAVAAALMLALREHFPVAVVVGTAGYLVTIGAFEHFFTPGRRRRRPLLAAKGGSGCLISAAGRRSSRAAPGVSASRSPASSPTSGARVAILARSSDQLEPAPAETGRAGVARGRARTRVGGLGARTDPRRAGPGRFAGEQRGGTLRDRSARRRRPGPVVGRPGDERARLVPSASVPSCPRCSSAIAGGS